MARISFSLATARADRGRRMNRFEFGKLSVQTGTAMFNKAALAPLANRVPRFLIRLALLEFFALVVELFRLGQRQVAFDAPFL